MASVGGYTATKPSIGVKMQQARSKPRKKSIAPTSVAAFCWRKITPLPKATMSSSFPKKIKLNAVSPKKSRHTPSGSINIKKIRTSKPKPLKIAPRPKLATKKMKFIKPKSKPLGRHSELTSRSLKKTIGFIAQFLRMPPPHAGAKTGPSRFYITRGSRSRFSVPVCRKIKTGPKLGRFVVSGIPDCVLTSKIFRDLSVFLAQFNLELHELKTSQCAESGRLIWLVVNITPEAKDILSRHGEGISGCNHHIFSIPQAIEVFPRYLHLNQIH